MARYLCDFDSVNAEADKLIALVSNMKASTKTFSSSFESSLSSWSGSAKENLEQQTSSRIEMLNNKADELQSYAEYIKKIVIAIKNIEDELATIEI